MWKSNGKNCGFDVRLLAMEKQWKNQGTMMKKWGKTMEKQWKIAALMRDQNDAK